jgi:hypothetical protein
MAQDLQRIIESSFLQGYNDRDKPEDLRKPDAGVIYMAMIKNAFIEENKIKKWQGYQKIGDSLVANMILGQERHEPYGGSKYILRAINNVGDTNAQIEGWSGSGGFVALTGAVTQIANSRTSFVMANNATYIFNEANDAVLKTTNGTSASVVATIPTGSNAIWFHNYLFVWGKNTNPARLYFSVVNDPETYNLTTGYLDVNPGDNEPIVTCSVLGDELIIFKNSRIWALTGFGTTDFTLDDLGSRVTAVGCNAPRGVVSTGNDIFYISYRGGTPHIRSVRRTEENTVVDGGVMSDAITGTLNRVNVTQLSKVVAEFDGRRIWFALPMDAATEPNELIVMDTLTNGWTRITDTYVADMHISTISGAVKLYFGDDRANGKSFELNKGKSNDGAGISFEVLTPFYSPQPGYQSRYKYMYLTADTDQDVDLDVEYSADGFTFNPLATVDLTGLGFMFGFGIFGTHRFGATTTVKHRLDWAGGTAYFMQYRFANDEISEDITLREWELFYQNRGLRATK